MASSRDDLRDNLLAALQAAPDLPAEDRSHLADTFLDSLDRDFLLVPRSQASQARSVPNPTSRPRFTAGRVWWPLPGAFIGLMLLAWLLLISAFAFHHAPFFLFIILFFVAFRVIRPRMHRRGGPMW